MARGFHLPATSARAAERAGQPWYRDAMVPEINAWLTIAPDDTVTIRVGQTEMGTGVFTSCPMMVAEELQCDWSKVRAEYASPHRNATERAPEWTLHVPGGGNPLVPNGGGEPAQGDGNTGVYRRMTTSSSGSVRESRYYLQMAGAEARERLLLAAAEMWKVPASELVAKNSVVTHTPSGRRTTYGALAARAARIALPDPSKIRIKGPSEFTLIGTEQKNLDVPLKVTGQAVYGIDVELPGMLYATAKACPVYGGTVKSYKFEAIKDRSGIHSAVQFGGKGYVSGGVAVVADSWWRAKAALDALPIEWDFGANVHRNSQEMLKAEFDSLQQPGTIVLEEGGSYAAAKTKAAKVVQATYTVPYLAHARMEPGNATAIVSSDRVDLWTGEQHPDGALLRAAEAAGVAHAGKDPFEYRRELVARNTKFRDRDDWLKALDMVAKMSGWGTPLPEGWARGIGIDDRRRPSRKTVALCAQVVTVSISRRGELRLERVDCVFDEGFSFVNPLSVRKQIEGQIAWALGDAIWQEVTVKDGRVEQENFHQYRIARMEDYPPQINIQFLKTNNKWISGVGEEAIPQIAPAIAQAVFNITGKRIRSLPLGNHDLSWA
jgi:isoquinoline 1-oxidoreductase beta subunit